MATTTTLARLVTIVALALLTAPWLMAIVAAGNAPLRVVDSVDLKHYSGTWFEISRLPNKFQNQCVGDVVAQYSLRADGRLDVVNRCRKADGTFDAAHAIGRKAGDGKSNARLQVRFAPAILSWLPMVWGDYWIIGLGPEYTWAVVGTPSREYLWILSRGSKISDSAYEQAIEVARGNGFDVSRLVKTAHTEQ